MEKLLIAAIKGKYRFVINNKTLGLEDLYDIAIKGKTFSLQALANKLNAKLQDGSNDLFNVSAEDTVAKNSLEIVLYIIKHREELAQEKLKRQEDLEFNRKVLNQLTKNKESSLEGKSDEELLQMLK